MSSNDMFVQAPVSYYCGSYAGTLSNSEVSTTHFDGLVKDCSICSELAMEIPQSCSKPLIKRTTVTLSWNEMKWLDLMIGYQDRSPCNGHQGAMPYWTLKRSAIPDENPSHVLQIPHLSFVLNSSVPFQQLLLIYHFSRNSRIGVVAFKFVHLCSIHHCKEFIGCQLSQAELIQCS